MSDWEGYEIVQDHGEPGQKRYLFYHRYHKFFDRARSLEGDYTGIRQVIVVIMTYDHDGRPFQWKAFNGYVPEGMPADYAVKCVGSFGDLVAKELVAEMARQFGTADPKLMRYYDR